MGVSQSSNMKVLTVLLHKLESRLLGQILITSDADDTTLMAEAKTKEPLDESERGE